MNTCDLEEVKHMAIQKFIELAEQPERWEHEMSFYGSGWQHILGSYRVTEYTIGCPTVRLGEEVVAFVSTPSLRKVKFKKNGECNKADLKKANAELLKEVEEHNKKPVVKAIKKLKEYAYNQWCEKHAEEMKQKMEESCRNIQRLIPAEVTLPDRGDELKLGWVEKIKGWFKG